MKKKIALGLLTIALLIGGATTAFAQTDLSKAGELKDLYSQMFSLQKQIVEKQAEAGAITKEEAESAKKFIDQDQTYRNQAIDNGDLGGFYGQHCGGYGSNMMNQGLSSTNYNL
ncbi:MULTISPECIES: DUF2680 domain-containing protein [Desulfitobacterium]|uniref:DUF2680 domain-containing protein n=1 Tax=Desulfitobacterium dehalogenans (strain ATCC 51507 / DSM 9161 / JW/IU-DC1) TaxID=756499 RepID=I4A7S2_DESDJ|nr:MULTISPECIES: DUF2680 domain-containing protein [Desulfitobacterium]AFM00007.1 Protein of unknown function (DUF2680) [Desulfitobacterium dehalogenans ATCC 51507]